MCYDVFMGTTHITIRVPNEQLAEIDAEARRLDRSRAWVILRRLRGAKGVDVSDAGAAGQRTGDGGTMPVLRKAKGAKKRLREVQSVRGELVSERGHVEGPEERPHEGHYAYRNGGQWYCSDCKEYF